MRTTGVVLVAMVLLMSCSVGADSWGSVELACLKSCHLCKVLYGQNFQGRVCAISCKESHGQLYLDCLDPLSIEPFLAIPSTAYYQFKRLYSA